MQNKIQNIINDFKFDIIAHAILNLFLFSILIFLFCLFTFKLKTNKKVYNLRLIAIVAIFLVGTKIVYLIPAFIDVHTNSIQLIDIQEYHSTYNQQTFASMNPKGISIDFIDFNGNHSYGYPLDDSNIPKKGYGTILYAKHSKYILDYDLKSKE